MGFDDFDEGGEYRLPLPPQDRLWRHPSEIGALAAAGHVSPRVIGPRWPWGIAVLSAVGGAVAVSALWLALGFDPQIIRVTKQVSTQPVTTEQPRVVAVDEWARELEAAARPAVAGIVAADTANEGLSAVTYLDDGHLLTAASALGVGAGAAIEVELATGGRVDGWVVGVDPLSDVAVVQVDAEDPVPIATTADHPTLEVGDGVVVVGHASSVMASVVSFDPAMRDADDELRFEVFTLEGTFSDHLVGSPVVDDTGSVIAIVTTADGSRAYAVAIDTAREVADQIITDGAVTAEGWIGVQQMDDVPAEAIAPFAVQPFIPVPLTGAVEVESITRGSPAGQLDVGDWVFYADDTVVASRSDLQAHVARLDPGSSTTLVVLQAPLQRLDGSVVREVAIHTIEVGARPPDGG